MALIAIPEVYGGAIDAIYSFGDSLSDTGNDYFISGGTLPGAPYAAGRFSNGPIWIDDLAASLGLPSIASNLGGTNYAYGGAETGLSPVHPTLSPIDLLGSGGQISQFAVSHPSADPNALYTIWIGSNDLDDVLLSNPSLSAVQNDIAAVVANIDTSILDLAALGAKRFLIVTVPDLGKTPAALSQGPLAAAGASSVSSAFDNALVFGGGPLPSLSSLAGAAGLNLQVLDTYSLLDSIVGNGAVYGFANTTDACLNGEINFAGGTPCSSVFADQNTFVFWDDKHPTSAAQALVADAALAIITPEPASWMTMIAGLLAVMVVSSRSRCRA